MEIDNPEILAEIEAVFAAYEAALLANDNETLDGFFLASPLVVRYGVADIQYGIAAVRAFRATQSPFARVLAQTAITTYGRDFATASTLFVRPDFPGEIGRQSQSWVRMDGRWVIVAAHVSMMPGTIGEGNGPA